MDDEELDNTIKELKETWDKVFPGDIIDKLGSHFNSLSRQIEDLRKSRDNWRKKCENPV